ncbi:uncharacterized protein BJX67DRAFT_356752 [Aspergillus lucknowensis]|uniref:Jacalin-type lectin domain-containing protein n=1 Tax=Aspergillus lucknowensis TaxID=176173 RepID=A0ABR4LP68_9EURO
MATDSIIDGPYGGYGGQPYSELHNNQKLKHVDAWGTSFAGYDVLGGIQFTWADGFQGPVIGREDANHYKAFDFDDDERITKMTVYAGDGEGFVNGIHFETDNPKHKPFDVGSRIGKDNYPDLGNGEWIGAESRNPAVAQDGGAQGVVDNIRLYFND